MKRKKLIIIFCLFILCFLFRSLINKNINSIIKIFMYSIMPNIISYQIIGCYLINYLYDIYCLFNNKFIFRFIIITLCVILGIPSSLLVLQIAKNKGLLSNKECGRIFYSLGMIPFPFIVFICEKLGNIYSIFPYIFLFISFLDYIICDEKIVFTNSSNNLSWSNNLLKILEIQIFFTIISSFLTIIFPNNLALIINPFLEYSIGSIKLLELEKYKKITLLVISTFSYSSISQMKKICPNINMILFIKKRLIMSFLSISLFILFS